jgi:hypothetical protein
MVSAGKGGLSTHLGEADACLSALELHPEGVAVRRADEQVRDGRGCASSLKVAAANEPQDSDASDLVEGGGGALEDDGG